MIKETLIKLIGNVEDYSELVNPDGTHSISCISHSPMTFNILTAVSRVMNTTEVTFIPRSHDGYDGFLQVHISKAHLTPPIEWEDLPGKSIGTYGPLSPVSFELIAEAKHPTGYGPDEHAFAGHMIVEGKKYGSMTLPPDLAKAKEQLVDRSISMMGLKLDENRGLKRAALFLGLKPL